MFKKYTAWFKKACRRSAAYFGDYKEEIAEANFIILKKASVFSFLTLCIYSIWAQFIFDNDVLDGFYLLFFGLNGLMTLIVWRFNKTWSHSFRAVNGMCMLFIALVMGFIISISIFPFPDSPAIFFPIFYILMTAAFVFPYCLGNLYTGLYAILFALLAKCYKGEMACVYDLSAALTAWLMGLVLSFLVLDLRLRENDMRRKLESFSYLDPVTGLPNRRAFEKEAERLHTESLQTNQPCAVFMIDIDHFKEYNDRYGHLEGDRCLLRIGVALKASFSPETLFVARYGGEEFVCILHGSAADGTAQIAEEVVACVRQENIAADYSKTGRVTVSVGVSWEKQVQSEEWRQLRQADTALYYAKEHGRDQIVFYRPEMGLK